MGQTRFEENKRNRGIGASIFTYKSSIPKWNSFTVTTDELIPREAISQTIGEINKNLKIHKKNATPN